MTGRTPAAQRGPGEGIGLVGMLPTPLTADATHVDHASLVAVARVMVERGCTSLVALGVVGEPGALSTAEQLAVLTTVREALPATPLTAALMVGDEDAVLETARRLRGALPLLDSVLVPVPSGSPEVTRAFLQRVHAATGLPVVVQDYPGATGVRISVDDLVRACADLPFVAAVKCEAPPTFLRIAELARRTDTVLMAGLGGANLVEELRAGARSVACGITRPEVLSAVVAAWSDGHERAARALLAGIGALIALETHAGTSIGVRKEHWRRQGVIASAAVRPPALPYPEDLSLASESLGLG